MKKNNYNAHEKLNQNMLNPQQQDAVNTIDGPLLINAGAGSGKTHTLTERVVSMIRDHEILPKSIFCVTFTNKAAREMRERIAKKLGIEGENINPFRDARLPLVGTFHSVAAFFLRMFADRVGYGKDFVIYDADDCLRLVKSIMKEQNINDKEFNPRAIHGGISRAKGDGLSPDEYSQTVDSYAASVLLDVYRIYAGKMKQQNAMDFDDLLLLFRKTLDIPEVVDFFHNRFSHFLVDEYQDTNHLQYEIIRILASKTRNLCVVGDDWQGIYSWRGADIQNIIDFKKDYPEAKIINLEENYRSTKNIINAANAVIKNNANQMEKTLFTNKPEGEKVTLIEGLDEKHEAEQIATLIRDTKAEDYSEFAILYRTNGQSRLLEEALIKKNISYRVFGGVKFYERKEIKDILAYIRVIFNPLDLLSLRRIINVPGRKIGEKSLENFEKLMENEHLNIAEISENEWLLNAMTGVGANGIRAFCSSYKIFREISKEKTIAELMDDIIKRTRYDEYLKAEYDDAEYEGKMENLAEFMSMASRYDGLMYPENIATFLEDIALITDQDREQDEKNNAGHVSLMTVHLAKGLEFPIVFIAGAEEGIFPHSRSLVDGAALEEERRLMYVAITRAKEKLYISRAYERYNFGSYSANPKSRFLKEIPEEFLENAERKDHAAKSIFSGSSGSGFGSFGNMFSSGTSSTPKPPVHKKNNASDFSVGMRVRHPQYGTGTIVGIKENIGDIAFSGMGIKKMNLEIAPINKI